MPDFVHLVHNISKTNVDNAYVYYTKNMNNKWTLNDFFTRIKLLLILTLELSSCPLK